MGGECNTLGVMVAVQTIQAGSLPVFTSFRVKQPEAIKGLGLSHSNGRTHGHANASANGRTHGHANANGRGHGAGNGRANGRGHGHSNGRAGNGKLRKTFFYHRQNHRNLPHVVKFSGGKSSGMLLFILLESGMLQAKRGDVVVFNNTSAEHPETYRFVATCKEVVEKRYGVPFFLVESCTYEDSLGGVYTRRPSFRLVNSKPHGEGNPNGYHWRGEVFEEMLSWKTYLPSTLRRTCTQSLKVGVTKYFLLEWFACKEATERLGHFGNQRRVELDDLYALHLKNGGGVPRHIFDEKKAFIQNMPFVREAQSWTEFTTAPLAHLDDDYLNAGRRGKNALLGEDGVQYLSLIGLRGDEAKRLAKIALRNDVDAPEYVYAPLGDMGVGTGQVAEFWGRQKWGLALNPAHNLGNCTYCFMKGTNKLKQAHAILRDEMSEARRGTPCDIDWWIGVEKKYGRDLEAEKRVIRADVVNDFIGFFGPQSGFFYDALRKNNASIDGDYPDEGMPCDCTE
ncbi:MAG: hypothetical protein MJE68_01930 [Proteobacteria bacterium]|nr:hypothetical protein [Pseudomonadota bacterium]